MKTSERQKSDAKQVCPLMRQTWRSQSNYDKYPNASIKTQTKGAQVINLLKVITCKELNEMISKLSFNSDSFYEDSVTQFIPGLLVWS